MQHRLAAVDIHHHWVGATIIGRIGPGNDLEVFSSGKAL